MKRLVLLLAVTALAAAPALAGFKTTIGTSTSTLGVWDPTANGGLGGLVNMGGGSFAVRNLQVVAGPPGGIPAGLKFGPSHGSDGDIFGRTYCVENVTFSPYNPYWTTIDHNVIFGGPGQLLNLTAGTRRAFAHYAAGALPAGFYQAGLVLKADANRALQGWFWDQQLVGQNPLTPGSTMFNQLTVAQKGFYNQLAGLAFHQWEPSVVCLNLWQSGSANNPGGTYHYWNGGYYYGDKQTQLVVWIPVPAAAMLGVIGLGLVGWVKRRLP